MDKYNRHKHVKTMKATKTTKTYQGKTFEFIKENQRYKVSAIGFNCYWYQNTISVREANRRFKQN
jgi:hypothetical protein